MIGKTWYTSTPYIEDDTDFKVNGQITLRLDGH